MTFLDLFYRFYHNKSIPCELILQKCYEEVLPKIHDALDEHKIWICIDKTTYSASRNVANVIFEILQTESAGNLYSLHIDY